MAENVDNNRLNREIRKSMRGCIESFILSMRDSEFEKILGQKEYKKILPKYAERQVIRLSNSVMESMKKDGMSFADASTKAKKEYMSDHYRRFWAFKQSTIGQAVTNNDLSGLVTNLKDNFNDLRSSLFTSESFKPGLENQNSIARFSAEESELYISAHSAEVGKVAQKHNVSLNEVNSYYLYGEKQAPMIDSMKSESIGTEIYDDLARVNRNFLKNLEKRKRRIGHPATSAHTNAFVGTTIWDAGLFENIPDELWQKYETRAKDAFTHAALSKRSSEIIAEFLEPHIDWEISFLDNVKDTKSQRLNVLKKTYYNVISEEVERKVKAYPGMNAYMRRLMGSSRQIYMKDGASWVATRIIAESNLMRIYQGMSYKTGRDIAVISKFGNDPEVGFEHLIKEWRAAHPKGSKVDKEVASLREWFDYFTQVDPLREDITTARAINMLKHGANVFWVGHGGMSSIADLIGMGIEMKISGLPGATKEAFATFAKFCTGSLRTDMGELLDIFGYVDSAQLDSLHQVVANHALHRGEWGGHVGKLVAALRKVGGTELLDLLMRLSMTTSWSKEFAAKMDTPYKLLRDEMKDILISQGIGEKVWNAIRQDKNLVITHKGKSLFVPQKAVDMDDKYIMEAYGLESTDRVQIKRAKAITAIKLNSALKAQTESVVPRLNPMREKSEKDQLYQKIKDESATIIKGVNLQVGIHKLIKQYQAWGVNWTDIVMRRQWQGRGTKQAKVARIASLVISQSIAETLLGMWFDVIENHDTEHRDRKLEVARQAANRMLGKNIILFNMLEASLTRLGGGAGKSVALNHLAQVFKDLYHLGFPRKGQTYASETRQLVGDLASVTHPTAIIIGALKALLTQGN